MTQSEKAKALKYSGGILGGGLLAGALMALATPTTMTQKADSLRDLLGVREASADATPVLAFEAPPEDLTPVSWQTAQQEYAYAGSDATMAEPDYGADLLDSSTPLPGEAEALPPELLEQREQPTTVVLARVGDDAADSAQAARDAAADVRVAESAAGSSDPADAAIQASAPVVAPETVTPS
ncbi:hypothetical protein HNO88_000801 [Novosphingobium chloroacetimidivorans]|uniref:Uncharacterized protein n=1 Tax=Novosphingobium chloroacetimidivorans TaxID=1428314 RepID=A0A7W7NVN6_9SPHN|nr:hypothetical protein [Novosphingobium chloroacetimidivorans]MBB4857494.1 hypothetical protein [Novosphingobium chloroacetimidivorans]